MDGPGFQAAGCRVGRPIGAISIDTTECPKIYRKSVLHLLNFRFTADEVQICGKLWDTQYP